MNTPVWTKSSYCGSGQCLEVAEAAGVVLVRDSRGGRSPVLEFSPTAWREFVRLIR